MFFEKPEPVASSAGSIGREPDDEREAHSCFEMGCLMPIDAPTDETLLAQYVTNHDHETFRALVERHGRDVLRVCRWVLRDEHEAEDAFQATFLLLVRKAPTIRDPELLGKWLRGTAYRIASRSRRHEARRAQRERKRAEMVSTDSVTDSFEHDIPQLLRSELDRLPDHYRAPIVLCYLEGFSHEETARHLRWPAGTVKTRLVRARSLLRERLERRGVALGAGLLLLIREDASARTVPPELVESTVRAMIKTVSTNGANRGGIGYHVRTQRKHLWIKAQSGTGALLAIASKSPRSAYVIAAFLLSLGLLAWIGFPANASQPLPLTEVPQQWLAPNLTNVLAVDCR
jgi:RNA polymerase sigma factor (sigma-70 family)